MDTIKYFAYICFGLAGVCLIITLAEEFSFIVPTLVLFVTGVLLTALDKIIITLVEIRDALVTRNGENTGIQTNKIDAISTSTTPPRSAKEIADDLNRLKQKHNN